ncbi:MAG TPA: ABC transporter permease [Coriobacteriia bacterium]|nr:ABC transporter permease [Coriobacteriia bacterium]
MRSLAYFIREALRNSKKNFSTTLGAIVTIFLSLLVIGVFMVTTMMINEMVSSVESQVSITVYIDDNAESADVTTVQEYAKAQPEVSGVVYVSKDEALERFKEMSSAGIADALDGNPLPASLEISLSDPEQVAAVAERIQAHEAFLRIIDTPDDPASSINYGEDFVERLFELSNIIRIVSAALVLLLIFVALIFINNTIRLAIVARRKEIAIMRLVGASNGFIRGPFLMEGALQAVIGAGMAIGTMSLICNYLLREIQVNLPWLPVDVSQLNLWLVYVILLVVGVVIGLFGSIWAMRRYLKV